jgi:hypothetical protein
MSLDLRLSLPALCAGLTLLGSLSAQDMVDPDRIHPRTFLQVGFGIGTQYAETNDGTAVTSRSATAYSIRARGEHFFQSQFGVFLSGHTTVADDINEDLGATDSEQVSNTLFLAVAFRGLMDDDFRLPVRFGPFLQTLDQETGAQEFSYETIGVKLSAEPEYIIFQKNQDGRMQELSAFAELTCGAGPTDYEATGPLSGNEDGYAFTLSYEFGLRYKLANGFLASASWFAQKYHIGTSESYNSLVFFGVDDDFSGVVLSLGYRF